ncbi:hypothetical protein CRU92_00825 [Arcobacter sp. FW59]|nr:hypothetical protein CRU92_00825 [Arcobacter sp. FW59]
MELYKHQKTAIKEVFENENGLDKNDRTQLIMACGTGKTITALKIHETYINKLFDLCCVDNSITILLFPSLYLVNQTYITYSENFNNKPFNPLIVCSDKKIGNSDEDDIYEIDTDEVNYPVTTQIEDIKRYLLDSNIKHKIVFVTYQSSNLVGTALKELNLIANFAIFDEAHKTAVKNNNAINGYASALTNDTFPITKRLFMTATPKHYSFKVSDELEDEENSLVFSMDNEAFYGKVSFEYSMRDAINDGIIADYKILAILIDDDYLKKFNSISKLKKDNQIDKISNIENEIREVKLRAIEQTMKKFDIKKALAFNSTIEESKKIASFSNSNICSDIKITHIDSSTSHKNRELIINNLKNSDEKQILTNAKLLSEGVDLPSLELVTILKNMSSTTDIIQTVGRCQRFNRVNGEIINPDKIGYVLLPIFIGDMNNVTIETLKIDSELKSLYEIVNSLKENDKQLRADLLIKKLSRKAKAEKLNDELEKLEETVSNLEITHINLVDNTFDKKSEKFEDIVSTFVGNIDTIILSSNIIRKEDYIEATLDFCKKYGYEKLKSNTKHNGLNIGSFRANQKTKFKQLKTEDERQAMIKKFECISPVYLFDEIELYKQRNIEATLDFCKKFAYEKLKCDTKHNGINLGTFRSNQKKKFKTLKTEDERQAMIKEFECISPVYLFDEIELYKQRNIEAILDFCKKFGYEKLTFN